MYPPLSGAAIASTVAAVALSSSAASPSTSRRGANDDACDAVLESDVAEKISRNTETQKHRNPVIDVRP